MKDVDLRALERAAQAAPHDLHAGLSLAAGLDRAGRRRDAFLERCRVAHLGHEPAVAEVDHAASRLLGGDLIADRDLAQAPDTITCVGALARDGEELEGFASGDRLVLRSGSDLLVLRLDRSTAWEARDTGGWAVACDDAIVHGSATGRLVLRRASDGELLASAELPFPTTHLVAAWGDRLVLAAGRTHQGHLDARGVDLGHAFGRVVWQRVLERDAAVHGSGRLAVMTQEGPIELVSIGDGRTIARIGRLAVSPSATRIRALGLGPGLFLAESQEQLTPSTKRGPRWHGAEGVLVALRCGEDGRLERRWAHPLPGARASVLWVSGARVVVSVLDFTTASRRLVALDLERGDSRWTGPGEQTACFVHGATVIEAYQAPFDRLRVLAASTGEVRADVRAPADHAQVIPTATGLALVTVGDVHLVSWPRTTPSPA